MQTLVYEHTTKGVVHRFFFSGTVSELGYLWHNARGKYLFAEQVSVHVDANNSETSEHS